MNIVSIIIVNYNTFQLTSSCIESIIRFTKDIPYEIILVDNASTECDPGLFLKKFPQIILIKSPENLGFSRGNNLGLLRAKGEVILLLNSDTSLVDDSISKCFHRLIADTQIGLLSCKLIFPDGKLQHASQEFRTIKQEWNKLLSFLHLKKRRPSYILDSLKSDKEHYTDWVWGTFFMIKKEVIKKFPYQKLLETFFMYGEDKEWCFYVHKAGYKILYYPETTVIHHISSSSGISEERKFKNYIWPHEKIFMQKERGKIYSLTYFILKAINVLLSRNKREYHWIGYFIKLALGLLKNQKKYLNSGS